MTVKFTVRIKPEHNPPDLGGGEGIIATQELEDKSIDVEDFKANPNKYIHVTHGIQVHSQEILKEWIEVIYEITE